MNPKNKSIKVAVCVISIAMLPSLCSCKKKSIISKYDSGAYSSSTFNIPAKEGYEARLINVLNDGDKTCIPVVYTQYDKNGAPIDQFTDIYTVDDTGRQVSSLVLVEDQTPCVVLEKEYVFLGYRKMDIDNNQGNISDLQCAAVFISKDSGDLVRTIAPDFQPNYIVPISDGFVIGGSTTIARYSSDGELIKLVKTPFHCLENSFFENDGRFYVIEEQEYGNLVYYSVDFTTGSCTRIATSDEIGIVGVDISGQYFFNPDGEYKVDLNNMQVHCIADWNCIDIRPPQKPLFTPARYYKLDDERFAISYEYSDRSSEVMIFHYDPSIDRSQVEIIKVGGFGVYDDPVLQWAVYTFNVSSKEYRVILEDYSSQFGGYLPEELRKSKLDLMQYFNEGNTPDIFYGTSFDYDYMGRNGMVVNLASYLTDCESAGTNMTSAASRLMIDDDGACYQLFSGYLLYGYLAQSSVVNDVADTSVFSLYQYAKEHEIPYSMTRAADIVDEGIRYNITDLWGVYDGKKKISQEDLQRLVSIVLDLPISESAYSSETDVINGRTLMCPVTLYCDAPEINPYSEDLQFIGYPSIHGSVNLAMPQCCLAISTTAKNKDICWEVLSMLLSSDAQKQTLTSGYIPVTQNMVDIYCNMLMDPENVTDEVLKYCITNKDPMNQNEIERFLKIISQADTIATYDWGILGIIQDEINSFYSQNRSPEQIADTLDKRLTLYVQENYQ